MKIEFVLNQRDIFTMLVDGEPWKQIHQAVFGRRPRFPKTLSSQQDLEMKFDEWQMQQAKQYALRRLSKQSYHSQKLKKLLQLRLVPIEIAEVIIKELIAKGFMQDDVWLDNYVEGHMKRMSLRAILFKLKSKGVTNDELERLADKWKDPESEHETLVKLIGSKLRGKSLSDHKERHKLIGYLSRKGYSYDSIKTALNGQK